MNTLVYFRDPSPLVLGENLPFLGPIFSFLPFLPQNLPFFLFSSKKSLICYTYSLKSSKNSTSNASLLKQLKKPERVVKIQDKVTFVMDLNLQMTKCDHNVVKHSSC